MYNTRSGSNLLLEDLDRSLSADSSLDLSAVVDGLGYIGVEASYVLVDGCQDILSTARVYGGNGVSPTYNVAREQRQGSFVYAAAARGSGAYGSPAVGTVFVQALLAALRREAVGRAPDDGRWVVTSHALARKLADVTARYPDQHAWPQIAGKELSFHLFDGEPTGIVRFSSSPLDARRSSKSR